MFEVEEEQTWDLSSVMADKTIAGITHEMDSVVTALHGLGEELRKNLNGISAKDLAEFIRRVEALYERAETAEVYTFCGSASDVVSSDGQALGALFQRAINILSGNFRTIQYDLGGLIQSRPELLDAPELVNHRHYLQKASMKAPYRLSQSEEDLVVAKDNNGIWTIYQLRESWMGTRVIELETGGKKRTVNTNELYSLRMDDDRETRRSATKAWFDCLAKDKLLYGAALRGICADHIEMSKIRGWPSPMTQSLLDQDVDEATISALLSSVERSADIYQRYLRLKANHFGMERLFDYDLSAPWSTGSLWTADWPTAKNTITRAYSTFDDEVGGFVEDLFRQRRVDSLDRKGRIDAAFTASWFHGRTSFVFLTYNGKLGDAYVAAHELGHAVHDHFKHEHQTALNCGIYDVSVCMAETASVFGELLLTEQLLRKHDERALMLEALAKVLERFYMMTYRTCAEALLESSLYDAIQAGETVDTDRASQLWKATRHRIYGDCVEWTENSEYAWAAANSLFEPNFRFYNYSYSFAQLLVFALYGDFKRRGRRFNERFKLLLSRGGSMSPKNQIAELGYDITRPDFWTLGMKQAERFLEQLKKLI